MTINWPPLNYPFPRNGGERTVDTLSNPYHVEDHNDTNNALNDITTRLDSREVVKFIPSAATTVTIDLQEARNYLLWVTSDITYFNIINATPSRFSETGDVLFYPNDFTITVVFNKETEPFPTISWNLINGDAEGTPSFLLNWAYGVPPTLSNDYLKSHVLYFSSVFFGYNGYVIAEELTQSV